MPAPARTWPTSLIFARRSPPAAGRVRRIGAAMNESPPCRLLAIGDVHGCSRALDLLLADVCPRGDDKIVTLGDYIDRGPDSKGVLDRLLDLQRAERLIP